MPKTLSNQEVKRYSIRTLCKQIANALTRKEIENQIQRFSDKRVVRDVLACALCLRYNQWYGCHKKCPYRKFDSGEAYGCARFSYVRYDGFVEDKNTKQVLFKTKARKAALNRYELALKFKSKNKKQK